MKTLSVWGKGKKLKTMKGRWKFMTFLRVFRFVLEAYLLLNPRIAKYGAGFSRNLSIWERYERPQLYSIESYSPFLLMFSKGELINSYFHPAFWETVFGVNEGKLSLLKLLELHFWPFN